MQQLQYPARFRVYAAFKAFYTGAGAPAEVAAGTAVALSDTKKVLRRLSKENVKEFGRRLAKPTHSQPILVANTLITQARCRRPSCRLLHTLRLRSVAPRSAATVVATCMSPLIAE